VNSLAQAVTARTDFVDQSALPSFAPKSMPGSNVFPATVH